MDEPLIRIHVRRADQAQCALDPDKTYVRRSDRSGTLAKPIQMANGSRVFEGIIAREGVLEYVDEDGAVRRELVPWETLRDSAADIAWTPVTIEHPDDDVTPDNAKDLVVGHVGGDIELVKKGGFVRIKMVVDRADALDAIDSGKEELSPGYMAVLQETPGTHPLHGPYDAVQVERVYNHSAIVDEARAGDTVRLRADSKGWRSATRLIRGDAATEEPAMKLNPILAALVRRLDSAAPAEMMDDTQAAMFVARHLDQMEEKMAEEKNDTEGMLSKEDADELRTKVDALTEENGRLMKVADQAITAMEQQRDQMAMEEMKPMADTMGVTVDSQDSADTLRRKLVAQHLGQPLEQVKKMDGAAVSGAYAVMRRDAAVGTPSLGAQAWNRISDYTQQRHDGITPTPNPNPKPGGPAGPAGPSSIAAKRADSAFEAKWKA